MFDGRDSIDSSEQLLVATNILPILLKLQRNHTLSIANASIAILHELVIFNIRQLLQAEFVHQAEQQSHTARKEGFQRMNNYMIDLSTLID